jgi:hypothetical protein
LFTETETKQQRDEDKILKLKHDIRENTKLLSELGVGTPIISHIKAEVDEAKNKYNEQISDGIKTLRKVQAYTGEKSLTIVLPKSFTGDLGIEKGDYLNVEKRGNQLILSTFSFLSLVTAISLNSS